MVNPDEIRRINQAVTVGPPPPARAGAPAATRAFLTVAGVQIYAYVDVVDDEPTLVVSIDYDDAGQVDGQVLGWDVTPGVPTEVWVGPGLRLRVDRCGVAHTTTGRVADDLDLE